MTDPDNPRLLDGLALIPVNDGYLADGGPGRQLLSGRLARELFPRLLPLLDGTHPLTEIAASLDEPVPRIERVLGLLRQRDLLARSSPPAGDRPGPMQTYLRRRLPHAADRVRDRLAAARVLVPGPSRICDSLANLLRASGVGTVTRRPADDTTPSLIINLVQERTDQVGPGGAHDVPWLPVRYAQETVHIGPISQLPDSVCALCIEVDAPVEAWETAPLELVGAATALAAAAALRFLGQGTTRLARRVIELSDPGSPVRERVVVPRPECPSCGQPGATLDDCALAEFAGEHGAEPPLYGWDPEPAARVLRGEPVPRKQYITPAGVPGRAISGAGSVVTWLLGHTFGEAPANAVAGIDRWVPSAAAPGSTRAYVVGDLTRRGPVIHYFDAPVNEFVALPGPVPAILATAATSTPEQDRFVVVLTGDSAADGGRLGPAAQRALRQDAGLCVAQVATYAAALGWQVRAGTDTTGTVAAALELDERREFVTVVMELAPPSAIPAQAVTNPARRLPGVLRRLPLTYRFDGGSVAAGHVTDLLGTALRRTEETWNGVDAGDPASSCVLYARRLHGLPPGLYAMSAHQPPQLLAAQVAAPIEAYLDDRALDPPALILFTGHLAGTLSGRGAHGYRALLSKAATAAGFVRLATADRSAEGGVPLAAGLIAGFPPTLVSASITGNEPRHRVLFACVLGSRPAGSRPDTAVVAW